MGALAFFTILFCYGEFQNWSFLSDFQPSADLNFERHFIAQIENCDRAPSKLEYCEQALREVEDWLGEEISIPASSLSIESLLGRAWHLSERIPNALQSEATLKALNAWIRQMDPYSYLSHNPSESSLPALEKSEIRGQKAYLKLQHFSSKRLCSEVERFLRQWQTDDAVQSLVIDLRGNPGGNVEEALCLADLFVSENQTLTQFVRQNRPWPLSLQLSFDPLLWLRDSLHKGRILRKSQGPQVFSKPVEIWMDRHSASAAEMFAASLQDLERAQVRGERSFGKSAIQLPVEFEEVEGVKVMLTTYQWYRPSGRPLQVTQGIQPDF